MSRRQRKREASARECAWWIILAVLVTIFGLAFCSCGGGDDPSGNPTGPQGGAMPPNGGNANPPPVAEPPPTAHPDGPLIGMMEDGITARVRFECPGAKIEHTALRAALRARAKGQPSDLGSYKTSWGFWNSAVPADSTEAADFAHSLRMGGIANERYAPSPCRGTIHVALIQEYNFRWPDTPATHAAVGYR